MRPIKVDLTASERLALERLAVNDLRRPGEQLRWLVMQEARRRGLLPTSATNPVAEVSQAEATGFVEANL